ncbi:hypothetical protein D5086_000190 [Populus alba]|uniref:Uncharacterized protein n=1 Tax=Populus alba TaxID=43335 RepID=A0ACC4CVB3_POPAL
MSRGVTPFLEHWLFLLGTATVVKKITDEMLGKVHDMESIKIMKKVLECPQWGSHRRILMWLVIRVREETIPRSTEKFL